MIELHGRWVNALPPNKWLQLTVQLVTPLQEQGARQVARQLSLDVGRQGTVPVNEPFETRAIPTRALHRVAMLLAAICGLGACVAPPPEASQESAVPANGRAEAASLAPEESEAPDTDEEARKELLATAWVKDAYVSPGHMNVGVLRAEKEWSAPMIGSWVSVGSVASFADIVVS